MFFTYGGFGVHPAHHATREILEERHFRVVSSAEFLGAHTFNRAGWEAMVDRVLTEATLTKPAPDFRRDGGRLGHHSEALGYILAEMQFLPRAYPDARW